MKIQEQGNGCWHLLEYAQNFLSLDAEQLHSSAEKYILFSQA